MKIKVHRRLFFSLSLFVALFTSCGEFLKSNRVKDIYILEVKVPQEIRNRGAFYLDVIPVNELGENISATAQYFDAKVYLQRKNSKELIKPVIREREIQKGANTSGLNVIVNVDGSGSMKANDPNRLRIGGVNNFFDTLAKQNIRYQAALSIFDKDSITPFNNENMALFNRIFNPSKSGALKNTLLLADFTSNIEDLKFMSRYIYEETHTPLYESLLEVMRYLNAFSANTSAQKWVVLFTDGEPTGANLEGEVCQFAQQHQIHIYAVGLGPASEYSSNSSSKAIETLQKLANCSKGIYRSIQYVVSHKDVDSHSFSLQNQQVQADDNGQDFLDAFKAISLRVHGSIVYEINLGPSAQILQSGEILNGTLVIDNAAKKFQMRVP